MKHRSYILILIGLIVFMFGCGERSSTVTTQDQNRLSRGGIPSIDYEDFEDGHVSVDLKLDSKFTDYDSVKLKIDIGEVMGNGLDTLFGGDVWAYLDDGRTKSVELFTSGGNTREDVQENYWYYSDTNRKIWRGVFEGGLRGAALVIVIDGVYNSGDGSPEFDLMSGSVWLRRSPIVLDPGVSERPCSGKDGDCKNPSGPLVRCWNVSLGPYDCRFDVSDDGQDVEAIGNRYSDEEYVKVGTFDDLSKKDTFKEVY